ncbi:MAG: nitrate reductase subunit beta [Betaproteobacteria bacterium]
MDVRSQISMVFHLDKCLGCHTCSVACKNLWTDRRGAEYMWWNNVETKPGTGYPTSWEDQDAYAGGWVRRGGRLRLRSTSKAGIVANIFHHPHTPTLDDYYEPWTYEYGHLFTAPPGDDQPTARPVSLLTGRPLVPGAGPNWDDDLGGSPVYAESDPNLASLSEAERRQLFAIERLVFFYVPRTCNHCLNPACVAACPSGAIYKRGEDGVVAIDQERCRGWRSCVSACPYKKTYYNWSAGKSEKCILCFPRIETGQAPACFHSCVGRIRYVGVLLYDAERIEAVASADRSALVEAQRSMILNPADPAVAAAAARCGIPASVVDAARRSPVYRFVAEWKLALPLHPEFRTVPMLFYVPPLSPVMSRASAGVVENETATTLDDIDRARIPLAFLASLFGAGDPSAVRYALRKEKAVRAFRRSRVTGGLDAAAVDRLLREADCTPEQAEAIYSMTALAAAADRFVVPPAQREQAAHVPGFGFLSGPQRGE